MDRGPFSGFFVIAGIVAFPTLIACTLYFTLRGSPNLAEVPWLPDWLGSWADQNGQVRTAVPYLLLGLLWTLIAKRRRPMHLFAGYAGIAAILLVTESLQLLLPDRFADLRDIAWGLVGIGMGAAAGWIIRHLFERTHFC